MRLVKWMTSIAAGVCVFAACSARAQVFTNFITLSLTTYQQGPTNNVNTAHGTNRVYGPTLVKTYSTIQFIQQVIGTNLSINFSSAAKLAQTNDVFVVIDGAKVANVSAYISVDVSDVQIVSGSLSTSNFLDSPSMVGMVLTTLQYNDGTTRFSATGMGTGTTSDTIPNNAGIYTETRKDISLSMAGEGSNQNGNLLVTAKLSGAGKGVLSL